MTRASAAIPADKAWLAQVDPDTGEMVKGDGPGGYVEVETDEAGNMVHQPLVAPEEPAQAAEEPVQPTGTPPSQDPPVETVVTPPA